MDSPRAVVGRRKDDPASTAARREALERLQQAVTQLPAPDAQLWRRLSSGQRLRTIAEDLHISYDTAKRRRRKLLAQLTLRLRDLV